MKKLIKRFMELEGQEIIEKAKEIKEKYNDEEIRISTGGAGNCRSVSAYYYDPITEEITEGSSYYNQNNWSYHYNNIGDIEVWITNEPGYEDYDYIKIGRIIRPEDEDLDYADEWTECKFPTNEFEGIDYYELADIRNNYPGSVITTCINCGEQYIVNQEDVENGLYTELADLQYNSESKCICSKCTNNTNMTVKEFLDTIEDEEKREDYREYMIDWIGMGMDWKLFA